MRRSQLVHVQQRLVDGALQLQCRLQRVHAAHPVLGGRARDVLQHDAAAAQVLVLDQLARVFRLFLRLLEEVLGVTFERDVVAVEVSGHRQVDIAGGQLEVDLLVDRGLDLGMEVLANGIRGHLDSLWCQVYARFKRNVYGRPGLRRM